MGLSPGQADHMIENVIGVFGLPLGIALNFVINGREVLVPMAIEEPSVVAGASFMARLARSGGGFTCQTTPPEMIGQMQLLDLGDPASARLAILAQKEQPAGRSRTDRPGAQTPGRWAARSGSAHHQVITHRPFSGGAPDLRCARRYGRKRHQHRLSSAWPRAWKPSPAGGCTCAFSPTWPTGGWRGALHDLAGRAGLWRVSAPTRCEMASSPPGRSPLPTPTGPPPTTKAL